MIKLFSESSHHLVRWVRLCPQTLLSREPLKRQPLVLPPPQLECSKRSLHLHCCFQAISPPPSSKPQLLPKACYLSAPVAVTYQPCCHLTAMLPYLSCLLTPFLIHVDDSDIIQPLTPWTLHFQWCESFSSRFTQSLATNFSSSTHSPWHLYSKIICIPSITSMYGRLFLPFCLNFFPCSLVLSTLLLSEDSKSI